jgi:uncharacterized protein
MRLGCAQPWLSGCGPLGGTSSQSVRGVLMVAVPDPAGPSFPNAAHGFHEVPRDWHAGPLKIVSSSSDPYSSPSFTERLVASWGAEHVDLGAMGHINAGSGPGGRLGAN